MGLIPRLDSECLRKQLKSDSTSVDEILNDRTYESLRDFIRNVDLKTIKNQNNVLALLLYLQ